MSSRLKCVGVHAFAAKYHHLSLLYRYFGFGREVVVRMSFQQTPFFKVVEHIIYNAHALCTLSVVCNAVGALFVKKSHVEMC